MKAKEKQTPLGVENIAGEKRNTINLWGDKYFVAEMDRRFKEMKSDKAKVLTLDQLEAGARKSFRTKVNQTDKPSI